MKRTAVYIILFCFLFASCDNIPENERSTFLEDLNAVRPVLLEDFTGQYCVNCPRAAARAAALKDALKENLVIVSIHAGTFSTRKFRTEAGTIYQQELYPSNAGYPAGMIDRSIFDGNLVSTADSKWGTYVLERLQKEDVPLLNMSLNCEYNEQDSSFIVASAVNSINEDIGSVRLQLWITEDHIIDFQDSQNNATIDDYEHNHVFRDAVNGVWGEDIEISLSPKEYKSPPYSLAAKKWVPANLNIVGFVYRHLDNSREVLHVVEIPLIK